MNGRIGYLIQVRGAKVSPVKMQLSSFCRSAVRLDLEIAVVGKCTGSDFPRPDFS